MEQRVGHGQRKEGGSSSVAHRCAVCGMAVVVQDEQYVPDLESVASLPTVRRVVLRWAARRLAGMKKDTSPVRHAGFLRAIETMRFWAGTELRLAALVTAEEHADDRTQVVHSSTQAVDTEVAA